LTPIYAPPTIASVQTQATPHEALRIGRGGFCLFVALSCFYLLLARGRITSIDEWHVYGTAESLVERRSWELRLPGDDPPQESADEVRNPKARRYSRYTVVPSLLSVPFVQLAEPLADRAGSRPQRPRVVWKVENGLVQKQAANEQIAVRSNQMLHKLKAASGYWKYDRRLESRG